MQADTGGRASASNSRFSKIPLATAVPLLIVRFAMSAQAELKMETDSGRQSGVGGLVQSVGINEESMHDFTMSGVDLGGAFDKNGLGVRAN